VVELQLLLTFTQLFTSINTRVALDAFSALTLLVERQEGPVKTEWWGAGMVICLEQGADLHAAS